MSSNNPTFLYLSRSGLHRVHSNKASEAVSLDEVSSAEFFDKLNDHSFKGSSDYSNTIFIYHYFRLVQILTLLKDNSTPRVTIFSRHLDRVIFLKACNIAGHEVKRLAVVFDFFVALISLLFSVFLICLLSVTLPFYLVSRKRKNEFVVHRENKKVFLIRSKAAYEKCKFNISAKDSLVVVDNHGNLDVPGVSVYCFINWKNIPLISLRSLFHGLRDVSGFLHDGTAMIGRTCALTFLSRYIISISQKAVYESCLNEIVKLYPNSDFYTGDKDDRFALLQTRIIKTEKKRLICLPHGLEYGFHFPGGLCGTIFYCLTPESAEFLNILYKEKKFVYSESVVDGMFGVRSNTEVNSKVNRICFFTEPRDSEVNDEIIAELIRRGVKFSLKLHPLESSSEYRKKFPEIEQIDSLGEAMTSTTCIARKSTALLEASKRGSKAIAVLVNEKDRIYVTKVFPSLCSESIRWVFSFKELQEAI